MTKGTKGSAWSDTTNTASSFLFQSDASRTLSQVSQLAQSQEIPLFHSSITPKLISYSILQDHLIWGSIMSSTTPSINPWSPKSPLYPDYDEWRLHRAGLITPNPNIFLKTPKIPKSSPSTRMLCFEITRKLWNYWNFVSTRKMFKYALKLQSPLHIAPWNRTLKTHISLNIAIPVTPTPGQYHCSW